jgi:hypothetical protein
MQHLVCQQCHKVALNGPTLVCPRAAQSVMATCACGDEAGHKFQTFGQLMEEVLAGANARGSPLVRLPGCLRTTLPDMPTVRHTAALFHACSRTPGFAASAIALLLDMDWAKGTQPCVKAALTA